MTFLKIARTQLLHSARVVMAKLLTVQIVGSNIQFSTPLYLPPGQKKNGVRCFEEAKNNTDPLCRHERESLQLIPSKKSLFGLDIKNKN
jgi:hypothetical protein